MSEKELLDYMIAHKVTTVTEYMCGMVLFLRWPEVEAILRSWINKGLVKSPGKGTFWVIRSLDQYRDQEYDDAPQPLAARGDAEEE